jgi:transcriptional regulator with XRE-family HTH domain
MVMHDFKKLIGKRLKSVRKSKGKTQEQIAEGAGISSKYLSRIELGLENPTLDTFIKIAKSLNVEAVELFELDIEEAPGRLREMVTKLIKDASPDKLKTSIKLIRAVLH